MKVYIMRHGKTVWNEKGITQGRTNNRLSQNGKISTQEISLKYKDINFDIIYASPLMRTMQTANIMNKYHNSKIIKDQRLIEIDQGIFSGKCHFNLSEEEKKLKHTRDASCGMESYENAYERVKNFVEELKKIKSCKNILIITHNVNASFIADIFNGLKIDFNNPSHLRNFDNAEIKSFDI